MKGYRKVAVKTRLEKIVSRFPFGAVFRSLKRAKDENLDAKQLSAEIPKLVGVWGEGFTMEECRQELVNDIGIVRFVQQ